MSLLAATFLASAPVVRPPEPVVQHYRASMSPSCSEWTQANKGEGPDPEIAKLIYTGWVRGYLSGLNVFGPYQTRDIIGGRAPSSYSSIVDEYCARHADRIVADAMDSVASALSGEPAIPVAREKFTGKRKAVVNWASTCADWQQPNKIARMGDRIVLHGYLTAHNRFGPDTDGDATGRVTGDVVEGFVDRWCEGHREALLFLAVEPLVEFMRTERAAGRLPPNGRYSTDVVSDR
ncbi:hypothetical protein A6F68_01415 [Tsuneonella dongtanensis]|uniref:Uncharacterized protein n=1 Tax=Tsuneonella dongtanensis TaxID=692370 RepID=A0A1B2ACV5_9SPHN|nr:hypothetical protein [Tsuneonella dongtanensis]ANY19931.1 hypothetical protein A6F68_01415 [Tsuneonella dongtanensis]